MISDNERREVARRLREYDYEEARELLVDCADWGERVINMLDCGDTEGECYAALADLIDPEPERTCHVECYPPGYEDNLHYEVCSECGTILTASRPGDRHAARASYCPNCGARVMDDARD